MRAREPDSSGYVVTDGVRVYYEVHGTGATTLLLLPCYPLVHSGLWKMQVPYLARHHRVVLYDPRGNGRSDRPSDPREYADVRYVEDALAVMDATGTDQAVVIGLSLGGLWGSVLATSHPDRVLGLVAINPSLPIAPVRPDRIDIDFEGDIDAPVGWHKFNRGHWVRDFDDFVRFFFEECASDAHSTKLFDDLSGYGAETDAATMTHFTDAPKLTTEEVEKLLPEVACPVLVLHGTDDRISDVRRGERMAELTGGDFVRLQDAGHLPCGRYPVAVNHAIERFVRKVTGVGVRPPRSTPRLAGQRLLWVSSPIGLGHVGRDLAIVRELRRRRPDLMVEWLAQPPVTRVLGDAGETIHPASAELASESAHWESEADDHSLPAFYALRRMDEILCANYMLFDDVVGDTRYDLWVGDESWEVDYFLHENPRRKRAPYAFLTDVVGFLPTGPRDDPDEARICTDYNAEMIGHRAAHPELRDLSLFVGGYDELPDASFGPGLPGIREWTRDWFDSVDYVLPFDPAAYRDTEALRTRLGHGTGYPLLVASVGGTDVGRGLLHRIADGFDLLRQSVPDARMLMVTGPRVDPRELPDVDGLEKRGYVPRLFEHLACADAAVVQGGLSTTMELVATGRPFVYVPLARHWEQQHFVSHRLDHYRAGHRLDYACSGPKEMAAAMQAALASTPDYRPVTPGGAARAADRLAALLRS